ncbi:MAG: hypothetical protein R3C18_22660 [Planctomycetaceae bacterium]
MADWLVLESNGEELRCLVARSQSGGVEISDAAHVELPENFSTDIGVAVECVRGLIPNSGVTQTLLVLPRDVVVFRQFDLPSVPPEELPDLVTLQAATKFSTPVDEIIIDYIPFEPRAEGMDFAVLAASVERDLLKHWRTVCERVGLQLVGCTVRPTAIVETVVRLAEYNVSPLPPTLVVVEDKNRIEMLLMDEGRLLFGSNIPPRPEGTPLDGLLDRESKRAMVALAESHPGVSIEEAVLCGSAPHLEDWLTRRFPNRLKRITQSDASRANVQFRCEPKSVSFASIGWILAQENAQAPRIDFVRPRKRPEAKQWTRLQLGGIAAAVALVLIAAYVSWWMTLSGLQSEAKDIQNLASKLEMQNDGDSPVRDSREAIKTWEDGREDHTALLKHLNDLAPGTDRLYFTSLNLAPKTGDLKIRIKGSGQARTDDDVSDMYRQLEGKGFVIRPKAMNRGTKDPDYPISFELDADWTEERPQEEPETEA